LIFKGGILKAWGKKTAVAINRGFFNTLPQLREVSAEQADIAWFVYDLVKDTTTNSYKLERGKVTYTQFEESLEKITRSIPGDVSVFLEVLQAKVDEKLENNNPPDTEVISAPF
jgi:hypothetical protein